MDPESLITRLLPALAVFLTATLARPRMLPVPSEERPASLPILIVCPIRERFNVAIRPLPVDFSARSALPAFRMFTFAAFAWPVPLDSPLPPIMTTLPKRDRLALATLLPAFAVPREFPEIPLPALPAP